MSKTATLSSNSPETKISKGWKLFIAIVICQSVGIISGLLTNTKNNFWFDNIQKPSWNPPGFLFAPIWTTLYLLMGISLWMVWKSKTLQSEKFKTCVLFAIQLFLNFWWTIIFFEFQMPMLAFIEIIIMIFLIIFTIFRFSDISKTAAWLLVPYVSWVCFAAILNYNLWILNS